MFPRFPINDLTFDNVWPIWTHLITANFVVCRDTNELFSERSFSEATNKAMSFRAGKSGFKDLLSIVSYIPL